MDDKLIGLAVGHNILLIHALNPTLNVVLLCAHNYGSITSYGNYTHLRKRERERLERGGARREREVEGRGLDG